MIASEPRDTAIGCQAADRMLSADEFRLLPGLGCHRFLLELAGEAAGYPDR
jgi:hypothetical protein